MSNNFRVMGAVLVLVALVIVMVWFIPKPPMDAER